MCLLGSNLLYVQETKAKDALDKSLQKSSLQAQILSSGQTLKLSNIQVNSDGLSFKDGIPQLNISRSINAKRNILGLQIKEDTRQSPDFSAPINLDGVRPLTVVHFQKPTEIAKLGFDLDNPQTKTWQSSFDTAQGVLMMQPMTGSSSEANNITKNPSIASLPISIPTTIDGLSFNGYGQLVIQASRAITYRSTLDLTNNIYSVTVPATRISAQLRRPILGANSPIEQIRLNQVGESVVISIKTISGWQIRETPRTNAQEIALQLVSVVPVNTSVPRIPRSQPQLIYGNNTGRQLVVIDPGHGGPDVGATRNGIYEKDIVLLISKQLGRILQQMGYAVVYTRTEDIDLDLEPRVQIAEKSRASVFVSVHVNSLDANSSQVSGIETYHAPGASLGKNLAELVHEQILASTGANDRGVRSARFYVIRNTSMPAILVETGYITNPSEAARLVNPSYQERMAEAIARGVDQFLKSYRR
ncbi:N-acetylmuramoyl-L-alanine amidase [Pseudanabaena sp. ABRG5-3]|nr:N-acetylmuramoyl-L-alanine amidase [Pseudanabaena sp. ABRG5-3]